MENVLALTRSRWFYAVTMTERTANDWKKLLLFLGLIGGAFLLWVAVICINGVVHGFREAARKGGSDAAIERRLATLAKQMNAELSQMQAGGTRLDSTTAGPGARLTYTCTLLNVSRIHFDPAKVQTNKIRLTLVDNYKTNPRLEALRKMEVELCYNYLDKDGKPLFSVAISPKDF
jgi:hypothetical protein